MSRVKILFAISQFFKGGAEVALLNLLHNLSPDDYAVDFVVLNNLDYPNANCLLPQVPKWVNVIDPVHLLSGGQATTKSPNVKTVYRRLRRITGRVYYDWAFHIGEWSSPEFVATEIAAKHKACWIHNDLNSAEYFDATSFFNWAPYYERYLFVSENSLSSSVRKFPVLENKSQCIHNIVDAQSIHSLASQTLGGDEALFTCNLPVVITCANVRTQKNHLRQVEAMALLKQRGFDFMWLNIGTWPDENYAQLVRQAACNKGLEHHFVLLGGRDNPYPYMKNANIVAVLSDYESWSMVITEALVLGVPVLATKTSGALEQITPDNGMLVDFTAEAIADGLHAMLAEHPAPATAASAKLPKQQGLTEFENLVYPKVKTRLLYLMDDINYQSGVQTSTFAQMRALADTYDISLYTPTPPQIQALELCPCQVIQPSPHRQIPHFYLRGSHVLGGHFPLKDKWEKIRQTMAGLLGKSASYEAKQREKALRALLEEQDFVVVPSEGSALRDLAASLQHPKKIQWIHTDYALWHDFDEFSRKASHNDAALYQHFDSIVTLSPRCRDSFLQVHPSFSHKTVCIENLLNRDAVQSNAALPNWFCVPDNTLRLITIGRLQAEKNQLALLSVAKDMRDSGIRFCWYLVGGGPLALPLQQYIDKHNLHGYICLTGQLSNPYPLLAVCDVLVLYSHYEGTPVTIREAQALGVPTVARPVGGIPDLIQEGSDGLFANSLEELRLVLATLANDAPLLATLKHGAAHCHPHTEDSIQALKQLFQ